MKKILLAVLLIAQSASADYAHRSNPSSPFASANVITANGTCPLATVGVSLVSEGNNTVFVKVSGTWTGTLSFFGSNDAFVSTLGLAAYPFSTTTGTITGAAVNTATANGTWLVENPGLARVAVCATAAMTGSAAVRIDADPADAIQTVIGAGAAGVPVGGPISSETPNVMSTGTLSAQCSTPTTGCSTGQWVTAKVGGRNTVIAQVVPTTFTATVACYGSVDNGVNWFAGILRNSPGTGSSVTSGTASFSASNTITQLACIFPFGGLTDAALVSTAAVTNTAAVTLTVTSEQTNLGYLASIRGSQPANLVALSTQDAKDAGRSLVVLNADGITPAIANTAITFDKNIAGTVTTGQTTYTITSGKILRVQAISFSFTDSSTVANRVVGYFRLNTGGACVAGSGKVLSCEMSSSTGTIAANTGGLVCNIPIPDGLEITGDGTKAICLSETSTATSATLTATLVGYEY